MPQRLQECATDAQACRGLANTEPQVFASHATEGAGAARLPLSPPGPRLRAPLITGYKHERRTYLSCNLYASMKHCLLENMHLS